MLEKVLIINEFPKGLNKISNIKLTMIIPIFISRDWSALKRKKYDTLLFLTSPININKNNKKLPKGINLSIIIIGIAGICIIWVKGYFINKWLPNLRQSAHGINYKRIPNILSPGEGISNLILM